MLIHDARHGHKKGETPYALYLETVAFRRSASA